MNGFWGYLKGTLILQLKAMPRLLMSPYVGAVRGAVKTIREEIARNDAKIAAFQASYLANLEESQRRRSAPDGA